MKSYIFILFFFLISCEVKSQENAFIKQISDNIPSTKILEVKNFVKGKNYNRNLAVFINFKIHSGKYRFFIYDLKNDKILEKAIVSHGSGSVVANSEELRFSNIENSYQSSLGKFVIGNKYVGTFGRSYRLRGLEKTNSNAMKRAVVIHSLGCVPDEESEENCCLSLGCPMLSANFLKTFEKYVDNSAKPIILYAFY